MRKRKKISSIHSGPRSVLRNKWQMRCGCLTKVGTLAGQQRLLCQGTKLPYLVPFHWNCRVIVCLCFFFLPFKMNNTKLLIQQRKIHLWYTDLVLKLWNPTNYLLKGRWVVLAFAPTYIADVKTFWGNQIHTFPSKVVWQSGSMQQRKFWPQLIPLFTST